MDDRHVALVDCLVVFAGVVGKGRAAEVLAAAEGRRPLCRLAVVRGELERAARLVADHHVKRRTSPFPARRRLASLQGVDVLIDPFPVHDHGALPLVARRHGIGAVVTFSARLVDRGEVHGVRIFSPAAWLAHLWDDRDD